MGIGVLALPQDDLIAALGLGLIEGFIGVSNRGAKVAVVQGGNADAYR